jgi:DeoR/GlpR family transcriptional regulator of sugar metabolism
MDPIDDEIIYALRKGKTMRFEELLSELGVSHNTLRLHLDAMAEKGEIKKEKRPTVYSSGPGAVRRFAPRLNRVSGVVSLSFEKLSQVCRFEKVGTAKG